MGIQGNMVITKKGMGNDQTATYYSMNRSTAIEVVHGANIN
jgi:hypothetical protein